MQISLCETNRLHVKLCLRHNLCCSSVISVFVEDWGLCVLNVVYSLTTPE